MFYYVKIVILFFALIFVLAAFVGIIKFLFDVSKWHQPESKVDIIPSIERGESDGTTDNSSSGDDTNSVNVGDDTDRTSDNDRNNFFQW